MADAAATPETPPKKKGMAGRLLLPVALLLVGAAAGTAAGMFAPQLLSPGHAETKPVPQVAPLEYVEIDNSFTANLKDTGRFIQVRIAVSTQGGQPVKDAVDRHRVAIVAAVLGILSDTTEADVEAPGGRDALAKRMHMAINDVLQRKSGIAGVEDVFLTSFVLQ